jgi:hypothetical protein
MPSLPRPRREGQTKALAKIEKDLAEVTGKLTHLAPAQEPSIQA